MIKISKYLKQKGQGIVEYAILLAFILGIAVFLQSGGLKDSVVGVFDKAAAVLAGGENPKSNAYTSALEQWGTASWDDLTNAKQSERIAADLEGLTNIAGFFNSLDMSFTDLAGNNTDNSSYLGEKWSSRTDLGNNPDKMVEGSVVFNYWGSGDNATSLSQIRSHSAIDWMQQNYNTSYSTPNYLGSSGRESMSERYFFSNEMNANTGGNEKEVRVAFTKDSSGKVTGTKVWVSQKGNGAGNAITATDENGGVTTYSVYVPKN